MRNILLILSALLAFTGPAWAEGFRVPGLDRDSAAYQSTLRALNPAGLSVQARRQAETRVNEALRRDDWAGAVVALETLASAGNAPSDTWLALARTQLRVNPPRPTRAAQAAWVAFSNADAGVAEVPPLLVMAEAFRAMDRPEPAIQALETALEWEPNRPGLAALLREVRVAAGVRVRRVSTEPEADPPNACVSFTTAPARRADFVPGDWIRLLPAVPNAAVTREGDQICIAGLPLGADTEVTVRAGMPGEDGLTLRQDAVLRVSMANRAPRIVMESRLFVLPRGQAASVSLSTINLSAVKLKLLRLSERSLVGAFRDTTPGQAIGRYDFSTMSDHGKVVWEGRADIAHWQPNQIVRTALPLPDAFQDTGAYVLLVTPGDGTPEDNAQAAQLIMRTDLAPTVWRGADGLTVQMRSYADAATQAGAALKLLARNNDVLAEATTGADGVARFAAPLLRGEGPLAPQAIHAALGQDFVSIDLTAPAFDLSDRGVEGPARPGARDGALDAFVYTDRGIYRPGETVQLMALLRDTAGGPQDVPTHVLVKRPNGQTFLDQVPPRGPGASIHLPIPLSLSSPAGTWTVELFADPKRPAIGRTSFRVDAFVPDRMAVDLAPGGPIRPGQAYALPVTARFLYGAPAANLTGKATVRLVLARGPPPALAGYTIGLAGEQFAPDQQEIDLPVTDAEGRATLPILLASAPDTTRPVQAEIDVAVDDPSGRAAHATASIPVRPTSDMIGIKPSFEGGSIDAGAEAGFDIAAVDPDGQRIGLAARMKLVRERPDWRLVRRGSLARYETVYRDEPIEAADIEVAAGQPFHYAKRLEFGRYRLEVAAANGLAATSVRFRAGWVGSDSPDTPDKVDVSADRGSYLPGETATVRVVSPFAGQATVLVLTDRVQSLRTIDIAAGGSTIELPVEAAWGAGAYATVHVFRGPDGSARPARAIGVAWLGIDPASRTLPLSIAAPDKATPRARVTVPVRTAPGAWVTLATVDEGVLRLTNFVSPDPVRYYFGRRGLGIDIRDDWGRLLAPGEGESTTLRQGGDDGAAALAEIPQKVVALFTPPVQAGADGVAQVPLDLPDFAGQVRLMAVGWDGTRIGGAHTDMIVRDPLIAEPLLPRFLAPGDEARLAVLLQNLELPPGEAVATVTVEGPLQVVGETRLAATLGTNKRAMRSTALRATGAGRGVIHLAVTGPGGFQVQRDTAILVRPSRPATSIVTAGELAPRAQARLAPAFASMIPGTASAQAGFGAPVRYDAAAILRALSDYPLSCLEQVSSQGLPLTVFPDSAFTGESRAARLQSAVASVLDRQRYDGGFGLWSANGEAQTWLSAYATEFLLRAQTAGAPVPEAAVRDALKFVGDAVENAGSDPQERATKAYNLYVLALAGQPRAGANRIMLQEIGSLPTPLARAQLGAALALTNDRPRAEAAFAAALDDTTRRDWDADRGSTLRDQAAIAMLLKESGLLADRLAPLLAVLPGADLKPDMLNTQEQAWTAAAAAVLGRDTRPAQIALNGQDLAPAPVVRVALDAPATARNLGDRPVWQTLSTSGVTIEPPRAARAGMRITRQFFTTSGEPLDLDKLKQNTVFVLLVEGAADDKQEHRAMMLQGLPAGWEVAGRMQAGTPPGMGWLGELSDTEAQPAADDRFAATMILTEERPSFRVAVRLRAVTPGTFELPGAFVSDMYRPAIFARQNVGRINVLAE